LTALQHDLAALVVPLAVLAFAAAFGWGVIGLFPRHVRPAFTPAAPAVGVAAVIVVAHAVTLVLPLRWGAWLIFAGGVAVVARRCLAGSLEPRAVAKTVVAIGVPIACAAVSVALAMQPVFRVDAGYVEHPTSNHDALWYVSNADWLVGHRGVSAPHLAAAPGPGVDPPSAQPAHDLIVKGFRVGESLVQGVVTSIDRVPLYRTWFPTTAMWLVLLVGGCVTLAAVLALPRWVGYAGGIAAVGAGLLGYQVLNQNGASVLGLALLPVAVAGVLGARDDSPVAVPLWVASGLLAAVAGTYSELLVTLGPSLLVAYLWGAPLRRGLARFARLVALSWAVAPLAWVNAVRSLILTGSADSVFPRRTMRIGSAWAIVSHYTGAIGLDETKARPAAALAIITVVCIGLIGAWRVRQLRHFAWVYLGLNALLVAVMLRRKNDYTLERIVMLGQPVTLLLAGLGIGALALEGRAALAARLSGPARARRRRTRRVSVATAGAAIAAVVLLGGVQAHAVLASSFTGTTLQHRSVRPNLIQAADRVRATGAPSGADVLVSDSDYVDRLWLGELLRDRAEVSWVQLTTDYFSRETFVGAHTPRWVLADDAGWQSRAEGQQFGNLRLIDTRQRRFMQVLPVRGTWGPAGGAGAQALSGTGTLLVVRSDPTERLQLDLSSAAGTVLDSSIGVDGGPVLWTGRLMPAPTRLTLSLPASAAVTVRMQSVGTMIIRPLLSD